MVYIRTGLNRGMQEMADILGLSLSGLRNIEQKGAIPSETTQYRIASIVEGMTPQRLLDPDVELTGPVRFSDEYLARHLTGQPRVGAAGEEAPHDGKRLRKFVESHRPYFKQADLARWMGVERSEIHGFFRNKSIRPHTRAAIMEALKKNFRDTLTEAEVFGTIDAMNPEPGVTVSTNAGTYAASTDLPRLSTGIEPFAAVSLLDASFRLRDHAPDTVTDRIYPVPRGLVATQARQVGVSVDKALCVEVLASDNLGDTAQPGAVLLGFEIDLEQLARLRRGMVMLQTDEGLVLRSIFRNHLDSEGVVELQYTTRRPALQTLNSGQIRAAYQMVTVLNSPL